MTLATFLFLLVRAAHVLLAALWVGAVGFVTFFLMPALTESGPAGGTVMGALARRKIHAFMASIGGVTVLTGFYLYYRFTGGFDPTLSGSRGAMVFGFGGICGTIALIIGGAVVGRNAKKMEEPGADVVALRARVWTASRLVFILQLIAAGLMAIGHYV